jgi:dTDP-4-dehydrorhamnose 3,5-epimerase
MKFVDTPLIGAYIIEPEPKSDNRGKFSRIFCKREFSEIGFEGNIVQINHSITNYKGTIRGMHYQNPPACEKKIVYCLRGKVYDVIIDIRTNSDTFLKWFAIELSDKNGRMIYIPEGFAHGFQTLTNNAHLLYFHTEFYSPDYEKGLRYDDPAISIRWKLPISSISARDENHTLINNSFKGIQNELQAL